MLLDAISKAGTIALGGHVRPDGDCAGSCMGLYNYVRENFPEKEIDVYLEELPNTLKFMKNTDKIRHEVTEEKTYDLFIALDCGDMGRLGFSAVLFKKAAVRFCVDHLPSAFTQEWCMIPVCSVIPVPIRRPCAQQQH